MLQAGYQNTVKRACFRTILLAAAAAGLAAVAPAGGRAQVPATAPAQVHAPAVQDVEAIAAVVNHDVISIYDVLERVKLVILSTDLKDTPQTRQRLVPLVLRSLIDEHLQLQEAKRLKLKVSDEEIKLALSEIEQQNHIKKGKLDEFLAKAGVDKSTVIEQVRAGIAWGKVIRREIRPNIDIGEDEINDTLARLEATKDEPQDLLAEIFLSVDSPTKDPEVHETAKKLLNEITSGASFSALARQFSQSASALNGGDMGWVVESQLDPYLEKVVKKMKPPSVSMPIKTPGGYYIIALRDRRIPGKEMTAAEQVHLAQVHLAIVDGTGKESVASQTKVAESIAAHARTCKDLPKLTEGHGGADLSGDLGWLSLGDLPADTQKVIAKLGVNQISKPMVRSDGITMLMVCGRKKAKSLMPTRDEIANALLRQRIELQADRYMRDLRSNATVDKRI